MLSWLLGRERAHRAILTAAAKLDNCLWCPTCLPLSQRRPFPLLLQVLLLQQLPGQWGKVLVPICAFDAGCRQQRMHLAPQCLPQGPAGIVLLQHTLAPAVAAAVLPGATSLRRLGSPKSTPCGLLLLLLLLQTTASPLRQVLGQHFFLLLPACKQAQGDGAAGQ